MRAISRILIFTILIGNSQIAPAHHSFAAHFVPDQVIEVSGTVKKFYWANPHAFIFLNVINEQGITVEWHLEMANTIALSRRGWDKDTIAEGDMIVVTGNPARVESRHMIHVKTLKRDADGFEYESETRPN